MRLFSSPFRIKIPCFRLISFNSDSILESSSTPSNSVFLMISSDSEMLFNSFMMLLCNLCACLSSVLCGGKFPPRRPLKTFSGFQQSRPPQIGFECYSQERSLLEWIEKMGNMNNRNSKSCNIRTLLRSWSVVCGCPLRRDNQKHPTVSPYRSPCSAVLVSEFATHSEDGE